MTHESGSHKFRTSQQSWGVVLLPSSRHLSEASLVQRREHGLQVSSRPTLGTVTGAASQDHRGVSEFLPSWCSAWQMPAYSCFPRRGSQGWVWEGGPAVPRGSRRQLAGIHAVEHHSPLRRKEALSHVTTWMNLKDVRLSERRTQKTIYCRI